MKMFKYFKRQRNRRLASQDTNVDVGDGADDVSGSSTIASKRDSLRSSSSFCDELFLTESMDVGTTSENGVGASDGSCLVDADQIFGYHSRLSMTLEAIVADPNCLSYFVQFLEMRQALPLIKFYLDTENFKTAAKSQIAKQQNGQETGTGSATTATATVESTAPPISVDREGPSRDLVEYNKDEVDNCVPELKTLCDLSMRKPLTDDEKSQIYAATNKQKTKGVDAVKQKSCSDLSLSSDMTKVTESNECTICPNRSGQISAASVRDAITIYRKYLMPNAMQFVSLPVAILSDISLLLCQREEASSDSLLYESPVSAECFEEAQRYVLEHMENEYLNDFLQSVFYSKYCLELVDETADGRLETKLTIYDILFSEVTLFFFMEFLEQHDERECLDFWTAAINFRKSSIADGGELLRPEAEIQADAMIIYEKFFSLQSEARLWMSDKLRSHVEERICAPGRVAICFDLPLKVIAKYMERKYFVDFLRSRLFANYLNDLETRIHEELSVGSVADDMVDTVSVTSNFSHRLSLKRGGSQPKLPSRHRKTLSDCSEESLRSLGRPISQQNTLLAMTDTKHIKNLQSSGASLSIDSRQLTDPDMLWRRRHSVGLDCGTERRSAAEGGATIGGGLKFGHINAMGRYERDFEYVDAVNSGNRTHWTGSLAAGGNKLKNAMRKLVNLPEDKVQEEIAWQVAEMIVKDVTSITLSGNSGGGGSLATSTLKHSSVISNADEIDSSI